METAISNQAAVLKAVRKNYLSAKQALVTVKDTTSDEATDLLDNVIAARNLLIEQAIRFAELSPKADSEAVESLKGLRDRAAKSPAIREQLVNQILQIELS